jgi:hypothetical protein
MNHVKKASQYPAFAHGYDAVGATAEDEAALVAAGFVLKSGKWYAKGYGPTDGGWGAVGLAGNGHGPTYWENPQ